MQKISKLARFFVPLMIFSVLLNSCNYVCDPSPNTPENATVSREIDNLDIVGITHNNTLDYLYSLPNINDMSGEDKYNAICAYTASQTSGDGQLDFYTYQEMQNIYEIYINGKTLTQIATKLLTEGKITSQQAVIFNDIEAGALSLTTFDEINSYLSNWEQTIRSNTNLTEAEKFPLIGFCAVGKYSSIYWGEFVNKNTGDRGPCSNCLSANAWSTVLADGAGFAVGAIIAAIIGFATGGLTVPIMLAGSLAAAVVISSEALCQKCKVKCKISGCIF